MARIVLNVSSAAKPEPTGIARFIDALVPRLLEGAPLHDFRLGIRPQRWWLRRHVVERGLPEDRLRLLMPPYRSRSGAWHLLHSLGIWLPRGRVRFGKILTVHDLSTLDAPDLFRTGWATGRARKIRAVVPRADFVITPSEFTRERVVERLAVPAERVRAIPHGIDASWFHPAPLDVVNAALAQLGIEPPYLLGTAVRPGRKGLSALLAAFAEIEDSIPHSLVLFGGSAAKVREIAAGRSLRRLRVLGYVSDDTLRTLYRGADAFAFPSRYEGFGLPILEAMACGTPAVAPDEPLFREVAGAAAVLFKAGSAADLAAALRTLLADDSLRNDLRSRGLARTAEFRWDDVARRTLAVYEEVLGTSLGTRD